MGISSRQGSGSFYRRRAAAIVESAPYRSGDVIAGRYEIKEVSGAGPVGFVFKAHDKRLDLAVAVKVINARLVQSEEEREHFSKFIRLGRKLSHGNLARVSDDGEDNEFPFYTTAFLEGLTLRKILDLRLAKGQVFSLQETEPILAQIAAALSGAHKQGAHSNLKPENVIILPDQLKVTDFGLGSALPRAPFMQAQRVRKADRYFAPEFIQGGSPDPRGDIYALGVILGEMLTGLVPDGAIPELLEKRSDLPSELEGLYRRALNENPSSRFSTPGTLFREFQAIAQRHAPAEKAPERSGAFEVENTRSGTKSGSRLRRSGKSRAPTQPEAFDHHEIEKNGRVAAGKPPDATQPLDEAMLPFILEPRSAPLSTQPLDPSKFPGFNSAETQPIDASLIPAALRALEGLQKKPEPPLPGRAAPRSEQTQPMPPTASASLSDETMPLDASMLPLLPPADGDNASTQALSSFDFIRRPLFASIRGSPIAGANATLWLALLTVSGLIVGTTGGYLLLQRLRRRPVEAIATDARTVRPVPPRPNVDAPASAASGADGCAPGMKHVPAGSFSMGTAKDDPMRGFDERILGEVEVMSFCIDQLEYPNRAGEKPMVNVSWADAQRLCAQAGKRLCTEQEWEHACKGPQSWRFPYGDSFDPARCNTEERSGAEEREMAPAGKFSRCVSSYGVLDLSGNVAEWTSTPYASGADKTQKGGSYDRPDYAARCSARRSGAPGVRSTQVGFRCCAD